MHAKLPVGFVWGASTSSYQIEGAVGEDGRGRSIWDVFCDTPGAIANGDSGARACDHYHRYGEDLELARLLGLSAYRFSIAWPRIFPDGVGAMNEAGFAFYERLIDAALARGLAPWICLYHWDLPQSLQDRGGWTNRDVADWFADYAEAVGARFGDRAAAFATFNEPNVFVLGGYVAGVHAPGLRDMSAGFAAIHNVNLAHGRAVQALRASSRAPIGPVLNQRPMRPASDNEADRAAARYMDALWNRAFAEPMIHGRYPAPLDEFLAAGIKPGDQETIAQKLDFFGLNHYNPNYVRADANALGGVVLTDASPGARATPMGWEISGQAFEETILDAATRYGLPIFVTENGVGLVEPEGPDDLNDQARIEYYAEYLEAMQRAMAAGADVRGYFAWSLLDNFEWTFGYEKRFGLVRVDYDTMRRRTKASYAWFKALIARGGLS